MIVFEVIAETYVEVPGPSLPRAYASYSTRQLVERYRDAGTAGEQGRPGLARAIDAHHDELCGWLAEEQKFQKLVAEPVHPLTEAHKAWLRYVRTEIENILREDEAPNGTLPAEVVNRRKR